MDEGESSDTSEEQCREESAGAVKKKAKCERKYWREWENKFPWVKPSKQDPFKARCSQCNVELVAQITTIKLHERSAKHKTNCTASSSCRTTTQASVSG